MGLRRHAVWKGAFPLCLLKLFCGSIWWTHQFLRGLIKTLKGVAFKTPWLNISGINVGNSIIHRLGDSSATVGMCALLPSTGIPQLLLAASDLMAMMAPRQPCVVETVEEDGTRVITAPMRFKANVTWSSLCHIKTSDAQESILFFPTCQVRVVRFYQSCSPPPPPPPPRSPDPSGHSRTSTASSRSQRALPDLHRQLQIAVGTAGPQPRLPDRSGHCRTSTGRMW